MDNFKGPFTSLSRNLRDPSLHACPPSEFSGGRAGPSEAPRPQGGASRQGMSFVLCPLAQPIPLWRDRARSGHQDHSKKGTVRYKSVEKRIGLVEPDMEEGLKGILVVASYSPFLCYETLPFL